MSSIEAVIAQARRPGNFTERRRFTLARSQAIQKLRQFALADPAAYILELVQSAIANGGSWIQIERESDSMTLAYVGGGIPEAALGRLFDFLFASKDDAELGYLRELAIGVNALMTFEPTRIIIESGDGSVAGTTRMEMAPGKDQLDVGRPDHALTGTFVRAEGLKRSREVNRERNLIEARCLAAPVPIFYNGEAVFGHSKQRIPMLPGYTNRISFDEGDLYGIIGVRPSVIRAEFALLTHGVLIESVEHPLVPGSMLGGLICFDRLRKSADHARIVRDERMAEMWLRVRPYAQALLGNQAGVVVKASEFEGAPIESMQALRGWLQAARRVVVVGPGLTEKSRGAERARAIGEALQAKLLCVARDQVASLKILGGPEVELYSPNLREDLDLNFYRQPPSEPPARPWLLQSTPVAPVTAARLASEMTASALVEALGESAELSMRVYTPARRASPRMAEVVLVSVGRELARYTLTSAHAGHVLVVDLPPVAPSQLRPSIVQALAVACLRHATPVLSEVSDRLLAGLVDPEAPLGPLERSRAREALGRSAVLRLRRDGAGRPSLCFALVEPGPPGVDLLGLRLFDVVDNHNTRGSGRPICARELAALLTAGKGWLLGVAEGAEVGEAGREPAGVVVVDAEVEALLTQLCGETGYRRVDRVCPKGQVHAAVDREGRGYGAAQVMAALRAAREVVVHHGRDFARVESDPREDGLPGEVWMPAWSYLQLAEAGPLVPGGDFHLSDAEAREHGDGQAFIAMTQVDEAGVVGVVGVPLAVPAVPGVIVVDEGLRSVARGAEVGEEFGVVGLLRAREGWSGEMAAQVNAAARAAAGVVYEALLSQVPTMDPKGPAFERATTVMLDHAGRSLRLVADTHGALRVLPVTPQVDRILGLRLFPGRRGLPLAAWQLVRSFVASGGDVEAMRAEVDLPSTPPVLLGWLSRTLTARSIAREPAVAVTGTVAGALEVDRSGGVREVADERREAPLDGMTLATTLEFWLYHLRPDLTVQRPWDLRGRVVIDGEGKPREELAEVTGDATHWRVELQPQHWLVRWAMKAGRGDREALAWLLLACYARINEVFDDVTNIHEGQFQRAVADALAQGRLAVVRGRFD